MKQPKTPADWSKQRRADNELLFKKLNQRTAQTVSVVFGEAENANIPIEFLCECSNTHCIEKVGLTLDQFHQVRTHPHRFAIKPGHEQPDIEKVIEACPGYTVVEKAPTLIR